MSDQVLGTYFFYQAFLQRKLLDTDRLINDYFSSYTSRIRDTFLPAISAFGAENVLGNNSEFAEGFLKRFKDDRYVSVKFFEIFGRYFPLKLFVFFDQQIHNDPEDTSGFNFRNAYLNTNPTTEDAFLNLLTPFYKDEDTYILTAIGLAVKYVYKHKGLLDIVLHQLKTNFYQNEDDLVSGFQKLRSCYNYLVNKIDHGIPEKTLFYYLMQHALLRKEFDHALYTRVDDRDILTPEFQNLRIAFFEYMSSNYTIDRNIIYDLLIGYLDTSGRNAYIYLEADQSQFVQLINENLSPENFPDTYFVQQYLNLLLDKKITLDPALLQIKKRFLNADYRIIDILGMSRSSRRRRKNAGNEDFSSYWEAQVSLVKNEINLSNLEQYKDFYHAVENYYQFPYRSRIDIATGFGIVLERAFQDDVNLGFLLLDRYLKSGNLVGFGPVRLFNSIFNLNHNLHLRLFDTISGAMYKDRQKWQQAFFEFLPDELVDQSIFDMLFKFASKVDHGYELHLQFYQKYETVRPGAIKLLVETLSARSDKQGGGLLKLPYHFFSQYPYLAEMDFDLSVVLYMKQERSDPSSDPQATDLLYLTVINREVFEQYIDLKIEKYKEFFVAPRKYLGDIWGIDGAEELVYLALTKVGLVPMSGQSSEDFWGVFFINLKEIFRERAIKVINRLINDYPQNSRILNMCWYVLRNYFKHAYQNAMRLWLTLNDDFEFFKKMDWTNHHFDYANGLPSQQRISAIQIVVDVIIAMGDPIIYLRHLAYLQNEIDMERRNAEWEIKRMYRGLW